MTTWEEAVEFCKSHYKNCYECPIRGACWENRKDKANIGRTAKQYEEDIIAALEELKDEKRIS